MSEPRNRIQPFHLRDLGGIWAAVWGAGISAMLILIWVLNKYVVVQ